MLRQALFTLTLIMFVIEVIEPSTAFVRAAEIKCSPTISHFRAKASLSQTDHRQNRETAFQATDPVGKDQNNDTILISHYSGKAWSFEFSLPLYKVSALYLFINHLKGTGFKALLLPPIIA